MQAWMVIAALIVAAVGQYLNSKPAYPTNLVKLGMALMGPLLYLMVEQPTGPPGGPVFLEWLDKAWIWALALPGAASLIGGFTPGMATRTAAIVLAAGLFFVPTTAIAQTAPPPARVFGASIGVNAVWTHGADIRDVSDVEGALHLRASLSPHISLVGSAGRGFVNEYNFAQGGARVTVSDVKDRTFSIGVGIQYRYVSETEYGLREWRPDVVLGWRPPGFPSAVIIGAGGSYGLTSTEAQAYVAARYVVF